MVRNIIAKIETFDRMRHDSCKVTCYEERGWSDGVEEYGRFDTFEFDTMKEALEYVELMSGHVSPTNCGVPAFPEE